MMGRGAMGFRVWGRSGQGNREGSSPRRAAPWMGTQDATISATGCGFPHFASHPLPWGKWNTGLPGWRGALAGEKRGKAPTVRPPRQVLCCPPAQGWPPQAPSPVTQALPCHCPPHWVLVDRPLPREDLVSPCSRQAAPALDSPCPPVLPFIGRTPLLWGAFLQSPDLISTADILFIMDCMH